MKNISLFFSVFFTFFLLGMFSHTAFCQFQDKSSFSYWQKKMEDPNQNFYQLVQEFEDYWKHKDKTNTEGTGYKQFKRWQHAKTGMIGPNGKLRPASYINNEIKKFNQLYGGDAIVGNWEFMGPHMVPTEPSSEEKIGIGRIATVAFHPTDQFTLYIGAPSGGIWKTTTGGNNWTNLNTDEIPGFGVSAILVHPDNPDIIFVGTGDRDNDEVPGQGIWKTIDGGITWNQIPSDMDDKLVSEILINPSNHNVFLAAAKDGVYISVDEGSTWVKTINIDVNVKDMTFKPGDPEYVYATGNGDFYRSINGGLSWTEIISDLDPATRCAIAVTPAQPNLVYLFATKGKNFDGFYISSNSGETFPPKITSSAFDDEGQGGYNIALAVDPTDDDIIFAGMVRSFKSTDGGNTWVKLTLGNSIHADQHDFTFSPHTNDLYFGNDGGLIRSTNLGSSFTNLSDGLEITQIARIAVNELNPDIFMAGLQDNGTIVPNVSNFHMILGGDGMGCAFDYTDDQYIYASWQNSHIHRSTLGAQTSTSLSCISCSIEDSAAWFRPIILDKDDPNTMFAGYTDVWRSNNVKTTDPENVSWTNISDGQLSLDNRIGVMEQCQSDGNIIYIVKKNRIYRTDNVYDANPLWIQISKPYGDAVSCIETHPTNSDVAYLTIDTRVYKSVNRGENWFNISDTLPNIPMRCITIHKGSNEGLYLGTGAGVYYKDNDMPHWVQFKSGLPLVPVFDMKIIYSTEPERLVVGTFGRGMWKTDALPVMQPNLYIPLTSASINSQTEVTISLYVHNEDNMADAENYHLGYYLSDDNVIDPTDFLIGEDFILSHQAGISHLEDIIADVRFVEPEIPVGTYYIGAYADNQSEVIEIDETDNQFTCIDQVSIPSPPGAPTNVQASDGTYGNKIVISWDEPSSPFNLFYQVFRNTTNNSSTGDPLCDDWLEVAPYDDTTASPGQDYYYWVKASDTFLGLRPGPFSSSDDGWLNLSPPTNVEATDGFYDNKVVISWDPPIGATHFKVWRSTNSNINTAEPLSTSWTPNNSFTDYTAVTITQYFYWVKSAMNASGENESYNPSTPDIGYIAFTSAPIVIATDGEFHDRIEVTWNSVPGASYYQLYYNTNDDPETASPYGGWQTDLDQSITTATRGILYYYWIKAAVDQYGSMASGFGEGDSGWRNFEPPENVEASDGVSTDYVEITWDNNQWAEYYQVYRAININVNEAETISEWINKDPGLSTTFNDSTVLPGRDHVYWVKCSNDPHGEFSSDYSAYNNGWRKLSSPDIYATKGEYSNKVRITWDPVLGAYSYRVMRNVLGTPWIVDTLTGWSGTISHYDDFAVVTSETYQYQVKAAYNGYGARPSSSGFDFGFADECGNLTDDPSFRSINFHGTTLEITQRIINNGSFPITNPSQVGYALEESPAVGSWNYFLGEATIPPLSVGQYYDLTLIVDLETINNGPVSQDTWTVASYMPMGSANCQSNPYDDYQVWNNTFEYTDALYGTYTIGGTDPDFPTVTNAVENLMNKGISDHVIFNVRPGTYYEQFQLSDIEGSGPDKTITFQTEPNKADNAELNFTSNAGNFTIRLDGCSYIIIQNMDITSPGYSNNVSSYGKVLEFINNAHHISILNNTITGSADDSYISTDNAVIYSENSQCNDILIQDNEILNGSSGIYFSGVGSGSNLSSGLEITGNTIQNFMYTGIKLQYQESPQVIGNTIQFFTSNITQCIGIDMESVEGGFKIDKNQVLMEPCGITNIGVEVQNCNGSFFNKGLISNNFIAISSLGNNLFGMEISNCNNTDIYHNSINIYGTVNQNTTVINLDCANNPETYNNIMLNNIISNQADGYCLFYGDNAVANNYFTFMDYNDHYFTGPYIGKYGNTTQVTDLLAWQTVSGLDQNSISYDPEFFSNTDLHTLSYNIDNVGYGNNSPVIDDIDEEPRLVDTPDIGADEYTPPPPPNDVGITQITTPVTGEGLTNQEFVTITIENNGTETIYNLPISYTVNGGSLITEIYPGPIYTLEWHDYTFTTTTDLSTIGSYEITAYTSLPGDQRPVNDDHTITVEHLPPSYCIPEYTEGCLWGDLIDDFTLNTINHIGTGCSPAGYGDFTDITTELVQGGSYIADIKPGDIEQYVSLWIDFDDDLEFESSEKLLTDLYCEYDLTTSENINIPVSVMPGLHRMRVRSVYEETGFNSCNEYEYGEAHDYTINILSGGNLNVDLGENLDACFGNSFALIANTTNGTTPYSYQWSTGETTSSITVIPLYDSSFSVTVTDAIGYTAIDEIDIIVNQNPVADASSTSPVCEGEVITLYGSGSAIGIIEDSCSNNCETLSYCESFPLINTDGPIIEEVIFEDINNNTADSCRGYSDFTTIKTTIAIDDTIDLFVTLGCCWEPISEGGKAFIDWNRDGDFEDADELVGIFGIIQGGDSYDTTVIVPSNAVLGNTILRVVTRDTWDMEIDSVQPCGTHYWYGETEDYTVEIVERTDNYIDSFSWIGPAEFSSLERNPIIPSSAIVNAGTYSLTVVDGKGCTATDNTEVMVEVNPTVNAGSNDLICETETYSLNGQATNYSAALWSTSGNGSFDNNGILDPVYTPSIDDINNGEVTLSLLAYASVPCTNTALSSMTLTIINQPDVFAGNNATINEGETFVLSEATASEYTSFEWSTIGTGFFDEIGIINPEYTPGTDETGIVYLILTGYANSPCEEQKDTLELDIIPYAGFDLDVKVWLNGPFNGTDMNTHLNSILPLSQPYNTSPWFYNGTETTALIPNPDIVDWILVELRDATDAASATPGTKIAQQAAFLLYDGSIIDLDGASILSFEHSIIQSLFVVMWHRNHIGVISASSLVRVGDTYSYNFTTDETQVLGGGQGYKELIPGIWGMAGGDGDSNGTVEGNDKVSIWLPDAGTRGYKVSDFNMDTQVDNKDKNDVWIFNSGKDCQVPE